MTVTRMSVAALAICLVGCRGDDTERAPDVEQLPDVVQPDVADPETSEDIDDSGEPDAPDDTVTETSPDTVPETVADTAIEETEVDGLVDATADVALDPDSVEALWGPTRVAFDPRCARCERLSERTAAHGFGTVVRLIDREVDDPLTRWGECLDSVFDCARGGGELLVCVQASICPATCIERFAAAVEGIDERLERFAAFDALFIAEGGACAIPPPSLPEGEDAP